MAKGDREYLRAYAAGQPSRQEGESVEEYARRIGADSDETAPATTPTRRAGPLSAEEKAKRKADAQAKREQLKADAERAKQAEAKAKAEQQRREGIEQAAGKLGKAIPNTAADRVEGIRDWIASRPTPAGAGALFLILILLLFIVVPVTAQGHTRLQLLWLTFLGRTWLPSSSGAPIASEATESGTQVQAREQPTSLATGAIGGTGMQPQSNLPPLPARRAMNRLS